MRRISAKARALVLGLTVAATLVLASAAQALPVGFWGVVPQVTPTTEQFQRLGSGGVESVRVPIEWAALQQTGGSAPSWGSVDESIERAARAGITALPVFNSAPSWAVPTVRVPAGGGSKAPSHLPVSGLAATAWKALLTEAVERYGPGGSFWSAHPGVPEKAVRTWQIWNEPNFKYFVTRPNPTEYGKLVSLSSATLKAADPGAKAILAGLFAQPFGSRTPAGKHQSINWFASDFLAKMYKTNPGIRSKFSGIALHPYTSDYRRLTPEIEEVREVLKKAHDPKKGLWITELGWSSKPPTKGNSFAKGPVGQVKQLRGAFNLLEKKQRAWNLRSVYWFSVDDLAETCNFCDGTGLFASGFKPKRSWYAFVQFTGGTP